MSEICREKLGNSFRNSPGIICELEVVTLIVTILFFPFLLLVVKIARAKNMKINLLLLILLFLLLLLLLSYRR